MLVVKADSKQTKEQYQEIYISSVKQNKETSLKEHLYFKGVEKFPRRFELGVWRENWVN